MPGQIIVVSGTSGSGKSTTCKLFAQRSEDFWLTFGIDQFLAGSYPPKFGHHGPRCNEGFAAHDYAEGNDSALRWVFGPRATQAFAVMHEWIATASQEGCNIILDHLLMTDPPILQDCVRRWKDLPVLYVVLKPPYEVLVERVDTRNMGNDLKLPDVSENDRNKVIRERLERLRPWFYQAVYANKICDIEIDSSEHNPETVCEKIEQRLAGPPGEAFGILREQFGFP